MAAADWLVGGALGPAALLGYKAHQGKFGQGVKDFLFGSSGGLTDQQKPFYEQALQQGFGLQNSPLFQQGQSYLGDLLGGKGYEDYFGPQISEFQNSVAPTLAARFAGAGANRNSSGIGQVLSGGLRQLGGDLAQQYAAMRQNALANALSYAQAPGVQSMNAVSSLLGPFQRPAQTGLIPGLAQVGSTALGAYLGGPGGAALTSGLFNSLGSGGSSAGAGASLARQYRSPVAEVNPMIYAQEG